MSGYVFWMVLNGIYDIVIDGRSGWGVLTGSGIGFYYGYHVTDPYAAYLRGYYFTSTSYMQLPPHSQNGSDSLIIGAENTISIWIRCKSGNGVIFTKQDSSQNVYYSIDLSSYLPSINIYIYDWLTYTSVSYACTSSLNDVNWFLLEFNMNVESSNDLTKVKCFINGSEDSVNDTPGYLQDITTGFTITIGA